MALDKSQQNLTDAVGVVIDRSIHPERVLGQACLVSDQKVVVCASAVFNYREAPWALSVKFPCPDVNCGVRSVDIHTQFNLKEAQLNYISQTGVISDSGLANNIAVLTIEGRLSDISPQQQSQLNEALRLPLNISRQDLAGTTQHTSWSAIFQNILASKKDGFITLADSRYRPFAHIAVYQGTMSKIFYQGLVGESALWELLYRNPQGVFAFRASDDFAFANIPDVTTSVNVLLTDGLRRAQLLPMMLSQVGGNSGRFEKAASQYDPNSISQSSQWIAERLWASIDSYITLDKLWQRVGSDTYSIVCTLQELIEQGVIQPTAHNPFHCSGRLAAPIDQVQENDLSIQDPLIGFYLDPLTFRPVLLNGTYAGVSQTSNSKIMLHTIPFASQAIGALILKNNSLVGLHNGQYISEPPAPSAKLFQMTGIGAARECKAVEPSLVQSNLSTSESTLAESVQPSPTAQKSGLSPKQIVFAVAGAILIAAIVMLTVGKSTPPPKTSVQTTSSLTTSVSPPTETTPANDPAAIKLATEFAGLKETPPAGWYFANTLALTEGKPSFGLFSKRQDQKILFVIWDDVTPVDRLDLFTSKVPFINYDLSKDNSGNYLVDKGQRIIGGNEMNWIVGKYANPLDKNQTRTCLVASYQSSVPGKAMVIIAHPYSENNKLDYQTSLWLIDSMAAPVAVQTNSNNTDTIQTDIPKSEK